MYTLMLMTSLSASPDAVEFNGFFRDLFNRNGCQGSCTGSSNRNASCSGSSCHGNFLGVMDRMRSFFRGSSCNGTSQSQGCYSSSSGSCTGSSYGCFGSTYNNDGTWVDPYNPYGGPGIYTQPPPPNVMPGNSIPFESSPGGNWTPSPGPSPVEPAQPAPAIPPTSIPDSPAQGTSRFYTQSIQATPDRAEVEVLLPSDAILYAESQRLRLTSERRVFVSPPLQSGRRYEYTFRVEYVRNGETITRSRIVQIQAGSKDRIDFSEPGFAKTAERTTEPKVKTVDVKAVSYQAPTPVLSLDRRAYLKIRIPEGATLEVDGRDSGQTGTVQEFRTPVLPENKDYTYIVKAAWTRDGHPESKTTQIVFRPGETRMIDLTKGPGSK